MTHDDDAHGPSVQERLYPGLTCFGCGPANERGLRLRSFALPEGVVAEFLPWPEHDNGFGYLNGGIIATLLDCHGAAALYAGVQGGRIVGSVGSDGHSGSLYVTAGLDVRYLRPAPLDSPLVLRAEVASPDPELVVVEASIWWDGKVRAAATSQWRPWRPR